VDERSGWDPAVIELLKDYPVVETTLVAWGDMDANHHVNNVTYFRYIEHARLKYFHEIGFLQHQRETGIGPILAWADCRFRRPLEYPDTVSIGASIRDIQADRFVIHSVIVSHAKRALAAEGQQRTVIYDYRNHHKADLPEVIRQRIEALEHPGRGSSPKPR